MRKRGVLSSLNFACFSKFGWIVDFQISVVVHIFNNQYNRLLWFSLRKGTADTTDKEDSQASACDVHTSDILSCDFFWSLGDCAEGAEDLIMTRVSTPSLAFSETSTATNRKKSNVFALRPPLLFSPVVTSVSRDRQGTLACRVSLQQPSLSRQLRKQTARH